MPTKKTDTGREYEIDGKKFTWHPLDDNDESGNLPDLLLPLRIKLGLLRGMAEADINNVKTMFAIVDGCAPGQADVLDQMDILDFQECFTTWQAEYNLLTGATPGE